jgi:hypothetical protein
MSKRQSLKGKGIDSLLFGISENNKELDKAVSKSATRVSKFVGIESKAGLLEDFERVTVPLRRTQVESLANLERLMRKSRSLKSRKQRITKNAIIRACLDVFLKLEFDFSEISDETELVRRIEKAVRS